MQIAMVAASSSRTRFSCISCVMYVVRNFDVFLLRIHKTWDVWDFNCLSLKRILRRTEYRNWTGKLENLHLIQSERGSLVCNAILTSKICSTNTLDWILLTDFIWEKTSSFSHPPYMVKVPASVLFCFFFSLDFVVGWTKLVWKGK